MTNTDDAHGPMQVSVGCSGGTSGGRSCRMTHWFPADQAPERWYCHHHQEQA